jgi:uncharacterized Fe-S cluster protein YjdI
MDELLSALCFAARVAVWNHVENAVRGTQPAIFDRHHTWIEPASVAVLIGTFASVITLTSVMWFIQTGRLAFP